MNCKSLKFILFLTMMLFGVSSGVSDDSIAANPARSTSSSTNYKWLKTPISETLGQRFAPPEGYERIVAGKKSFGHWLRGLPLKAPGTSVRLYDGDLKYNQAVHAAVVDIDVGSRDLQQCADAVMRLWAEYLWTAGRSDLICFRTAAGPSAQWTNWRDGYRPPKGNGGPWVRTAKPQRGYGSLRRYLTKVFGIANSASLIRQTSQVVDPAEIEIGQIYLEPAKNGVYGHAVTVLDVAQNKDGKRVFLIAQSYMPAQDVHVLKNPSDFDPVWYETTADGSLVTPEWSFPAGSLRKINRRGCG